MKQPYLSAEMDVRLFDSGDIIHCSDAPSPYPDGSEDVITTADPDAWVPSCNQGKPDYNAWG